MPRILPPAILVLVLAGLPLPGAPNDAAGCKDLKVIPRVGQCIIVECGSKRTESVDLPSGEQTVKVEGAFATVKYACSAPATFDTVTRDLTASVWRSGAKVLTQDNSDPASRIVVGRKGDLWTSIEATLEDGNIGYTVSTVDTGANKPMPEICSDAGSVTLPKGCTWSECASKPRDTVEMRSGPQGQVELAGALRMSGISCDATVVPEQVFAATDAALKRSGFEVVYTERSRADYSWLTARSGKRWLELMSFQDADAIAYQLTDVQAETVAKAPENVESSPVVAEVVPPVHPVVMPEPAPAVVHLPEPGPAPAAPVAAAAPQIRISSEPVATPAAAPSTPVASLVAAPAAPEAHVPMPGVTPPRPSRRIAMVVPHEIQLKLQGEVKINLLVDVDDRGNVMRAVLAPGPQTKDATKILDPAIAMMMQWRFSPARHNGHRVPGQAIVPVAFYAPGR